MGPLWVYMSKDMDVKLATLSTHHPILNSVLPLATSPCQYCGVYFVTMLTTPSLLALLMWASHASGGLYDSSPTVVSLTPSTLKKHIQPNTLWWVLWKEQSRQEHS